MFSPAGTLVVILVAAFLREQVVQAKSGNIWSIKVAEEDSMTQEQVERIGFWKSFQPVAFRKRPEEGFSVPIGMDIFEPFQASLKRVSELDKDDQTCKIEVKDDFDIMKMIKLEEENQGYLCSMTLNRFRYLLKTDCSVDRKTYSDQGLSSKAEKVGKLKYNNCSDMTEGARLAFEAYVLMQEQVLSDSQLFQLVDQSLTNHDGTFSLQGISTFYYVYKNFSSMQNFFSNQNECLLCDNSIYPLQWTAKQHEVLLSQPESSIIGIIALQGSSFLFINISNITNTTQAENILSGQLISKILQVSVQENLLGIYYVSPLSETPLTAICSLHPTNFTCQNVENNEWTSSQNRLSGLVESQMTVNKLSIAKYFLKHSSMQFYCAPVRSSDRTASSEEYQLNLTLKECPKRLKEASLKDKFCHFSVKITLLSEVSTPFFTFGMLVSIAFVLLIVLVCLGGYTMKLRQDLQNSKLVAEIAQIELDTLKLSAEYSNKIKSIEKAELDEMGETDFEPYQDQ